MLVGSKVRMLHGMGEGIVTKIDGQMLTVLLNEGLEIPMHKNDVVLVAAREEEKLDTQKQKAEEKPAMLRPRPAMFFVKEGIYLAGVSKSPMLAEMAVINHTDFQIFISIYKLARPVHQFLETILLEPKSMVTLSEAIPLAETHHWIGLGFQMLKFHASQGDMPPTSEFRISFSQLNWKASHSIPIWEKSGLLIQMDGNSVAIDPQQLKEKMMSHRPEKTEIVNLPKPRIFQREIDLHIEKLESNTGMLSAAAMLEIQINAFEKAMDKGILDGVETLIFIHGVGAGVLKDEIHKRLSKRNDIHFFKEGRKEKFGYGATEVKLK